MTEPIPMDAISRLRKAVISQKSTQLPPMPSDPHLVQLHECLSRYDQFVSKTVISVMMGGGEIDQFEDMECLNGISELEPGVSNAGKSEGTDTRTRALLARHKKRLDEMMSLAEDVVRERNQQG